jgi:hypothetical protein
MPSPPTAGDTPCLPSRGRIPLNTVRVSILRHKPGPVLSDDHQLELIASNEETIGAPSWLARATERESREDWRNW